ncbi:hypothetical protein CN490_27810 [Bacillus cereus]|nr:hypothetical protein CN490_27810 [Bacillus cereus]
MKNDVSLWLGCFSDFDEIETYTEIKYSVDGVHPITGGVMSTTAVNNAIQQKESSQQQDEDNPEEGTDDHGDDDDG